MKKVGIFIGSPRPGGNTAALAAMLAGSLKPDEFRVDIHRLYDSEIEPCRDCRACKKNGLICILQDGLNTLYAEIEAADVLVIGTPIYWYGPSGPVKTMLDRLRPYFVSKKLAGKKGALLLPAGAGATDCDLTIEMFKRAFETLGMEFLGAVTVKAYDIGDVEKDPGAREAVRRLADRIAAAV